MQAVVVFAFTLLVLATGYFVLGSPSRRIAYPPGPPGSFVVGNLKDVPQTNSWAYFAGLQKQYGDIIHLRMISEHIIVLNSLRAINALLVQRSSIYCSRPRIPMVELVGWDQTGMMGKAGPRWFNTRKVLATHLGKAAVTRYSPYIKTEVHSCVDRCLQSPEDAFSEIRLLAIKLVIRLVYGLPVNSFDDELVRVSEESQDTFTKAALPGAWLVNSFPSLKHLPKGFPLVQFHRQALIWKEEITRSVEIPFKRAKAAFFKNEATSSLMSNILDENGKHMSEEQLMWFTGGLYSAAVDTTTQTILNFMLAMVLHPEIQKKAQEEIDAIVGTDRLPDFSDRDKLPYLDMVMKETMRWQPVVPTSLPYMVTEDDIVDGYFIPKGSTVVANTWAISRNGEMFPDSEKFDPERWRDERLVEPTKFAFGYGRRVCGGMHFAEPSVWMAMATFLASARLSKMVDAEGREIEPDVRHSGDGLVRILQKFVFQVKSRTDAATSLLSHSVASV